MSNNYIKIAETRIKKSNIKNFGVGYEKQSGNPSPVAWLISGIKEKSDFGDFFDGVKQSMSPPDKKYLYITTYQNDNYKFYSNQISINKILEELEAI